MASGDLVLGVTILSLCCCLVVLVSIYFDKRNKKSYHLQLIFGLLSSNFFLCLVTVVCYIISQVQGYDPNFGCAVTLPISKYFFIASYGWTILISLRFKHMDSIERTAYIPPFPSWMIWVLSFILVLPIIIVDWAYFPGVSVAIASYSILGCSFNHESVLGKTMDIVVFEAPLLVTIIVNTNFYLIGLWALKDTPHSVVARQMRRAGGYMLVLVIVWVPHISYDILSMAQNSNSAHKDFWDIVVLLSVLQGFMNVCVYVASNKNMRTWLSQAICCYKLWTPRSSSFLGSDLSSNYGGGGYGNDDDLESVTKSPLGNESASVAGDSLGGDGDSIGDTYTVSRDSFVVANVRSEKERLRQLRQEALASAGPPEPSAVPKKVDIKSNIKSRAQFAHNRPTVSMVDDLDSEKMVRFGETTTRVFANSVGEDDEATNAL